jgi:hypothetical protein
LSARLLPGTTARTTVRHCLYDRRFALGEDRRYLGTVDAGSVLLLLARAEQGDARAAWTLVATREGVLGWIPMAGPADPIASPSRRAWARLP